MTTDTKLQELIINKLTTSQYDSIEEKDPNQIYIVTDAPGFDNTITNCITHIPQDIKYEIANDKFVLKAGSVLYEPSGTGNFIKHTTTQDQSWAWGTGQFIILPQKNGNMGQSTALAKGFSGTTAPTNPSSGVVWYDTTNNVIKRHNGTSWTTANYCLPIAITTNASDKVTSIDQIFNGFGYIDSTVFGLPGVKGLIPNNRNADGTLKNIEFTVGKVLTYTRTDTSSYNGYVTLNSNAINIPPINSYNHDEQNNVNTYNGAKTTDALVGSAVITDGKITSFTPKLPFRAVDQNDFNKLDEEAVKTSGNQTINGFTTFNDNIKLNAQGGVEGAEVLWRTGSNSVLQDTHVKQDMYGNLMRFFAKNSAGSILHPLNLDFETGLATTTTPPASDNSNKIATTAWVNTKIANTLPAGTVIAFAANSAPSGYLICNGSAVSRTTYNALFSAIGTTYGAGDGSTTFNVPNLTDKFIQGGGTAGTTKEAGLPNITGSMSIGGTENGTSDMSGALYAKGTVTSTISGSYTGNRSRPIIGFDSSLSSAIYGKSSTVQPPALTMRYYIKY